MTNERARRGAKINDRRTLGRDDETTTLGSTAVNGFDDVNQLEEGEGPDQRLDMSRMVITHLLFVIHCPVTEAVEDERLARYGVLKERQDVHLIVVTSSQINHYVFITKNFANRLAALGPYMTIRRIHTDKRT